MPRSLLGPAAFFSSHTHTRTRAHAQMQNPRISLNHLIINFLSSFLVLRAHSAQESSPEREGECGDARCEWMRGKPANTSILLQPPALRAPRCCTSDQNERLSKFIIPRREPRPNPNPNPALIPTEPIPYGGTVRAPAHAHLWISSQHAAETLWHQRKQCGTLPNSHSVPRTRPLIWLSAAISKHRLVGRVGGKGISDLFP